MKIDKEKKREHDEISFGYLYPYEYIFKKKFLVGITNKASIFLECDGGKEMVTVTSFCWKRIFLFRFIWWWCCVVFTLEKNLVPFPLDLVLRVFSSPGGVAMEDISLLDEKLVYFFSPAFFSCPFYYSYCNIGINFLLKETTNAHENDHEEKKKSRIWLFFSWKKKYIAHWLGLAWVIIFPGYLKKSSSGRKSTERESSRVTRAAINVKKECIYFTACLVIITAALFFLAGYYILGFHRSPSHLSLHTVKKTHELFEK